jgi:hypothetical protein
MDTDYKSGIVSLDSIQLLVQPTVKRTTKMEAVPRLPMIALELKASPEYVDFGPVLKQVVYQSFDFLVSTRVKIPVERILRGYIICFDVILS